MIVAELSGLSRICQYACILSVSDKTGLVELRPRPRRPAASSSSRPAAPRRALADAGLAGHQRLRRHRLSRDDGRPRQDAAPGDPRRHPRAPRSPRRPRRRSRAHGIGPSTSSSSTCIRSRRRRRTRRRRSTRWSRRSTSAARAWCARRRRISATCSSSSIRPTIRRCSRSSARDGRTVARVPLRADAEGVRAHRRSTTRMIATTLDDVDRRRAARFDASAGAAPTTPRRIRRAARPALRRESASAGGVDLAAAANGASRWRGASRARSCRTRTCSISTPRCASRSSSPSRRRW